MRWVAAVFDFLAAVFTVIALVPFVAAIVSARVATSIREMWP